MILKGSKGQHAERGSVLVLLLIMVGTMLAFCGALVTVSTVGLRSASASEARTRAFYLADSGAQVGISKVRNGKQSLAETSFTETLYGGSASVAITKPTTGMFKIISTGNCGEVTKAVEVYIKFISDFSLPAAVSLSVSSGTVLFSPLRIQAYGTSQISGQVHDAEGNVLPDQSDGKFALAMNKVPGKKSFQMEYDSFGTATVSGTPDVSSNTITSQESILKALKDNAQNNADIMISGSKTLSDGDSGLYGTQSDPKLVYAHLGDGNSIDMSNSFTGYGTLVIDVDRAIKTTVLNMNGFATWKGLILIYFRNEAEVTNGTLVHLTGGAKIIGGLSMFFNSVVVALRGKGAMVRTSGNASILYSKELITSARGTEGIAALSAEVRSYRILP